MTDITNPIFNDENAARTHLEALRWANGRYCPHCGEAKCTSPVKGTSHRPGRYSCSSCAKQFTVTVGTLFERSKIPLHKWTLAFHLMCASKKGISSHQLHRMLGVIYKTAWLMSHRIREAMRELNPSAMGGENEVIEADESFVGGKAKNQKVRTAPEERGRVLTVGA